MLHIHKHPNLPKTYIGYIPTGSIRIVKDSSGKGWRTVNNCARPNYTRITGRTLKDVEAALVKVWADWSR